MEWLDSIKEISMIMIIVIPIVLAISGFFAFSIYYLVYQFNSYWFFLLIPFGVFISLVIVNKYLG